MNIRLHDTRGTKDGWSENGDTSNTNPLLHNLQPDDKLYTTASVEFTRADTEEHGEVRSSSGGFAFELSDVPYILKFGLSFAGICTSFTSKTAKDVTGFFLTTDFDEPTR